MKRRISATLIAILVAACGCSNSEPSEDGGNATTSDMGTPSDEGVNGTTDGSTNGTTDGDVNGTTPDGGGSTDGGTDAVVDTTLAITGAVQKGPFVVGSSVTLNVLDEAGNPTGMSFPTTTMNDAGEFAITLPEPAPLRIESTGFYFDELSGELSAANLTLRAVFEPAGSAATARVNLVTHLTSDRVLTLVGEGLGYADATAQAEQELVVALGIGPPDLSLSSAGSEVDVTGNDEIANAYALALSALYLQAAVLAGGTLDAELQQLLNVTVQDLADNGLLDGAGSDVPQQLRDAEAILQFMRVQNHLQARVAELDPGRDFDADPLPNMGHVLDTDDDGVMNIDDVCIAMPDPGQEDSDGDGVGDVCDAQFVTIGVGPALSGGSIRICGIHDEGSMGPAGTLMCWSSSEGMPNRYQSLDKNPALTPEFIQDIGQLPAGELVEVSVNYVTCVRYANGDAYCHMDGEWRRPPQDVDVAYKQVMSRRYSGCGLTTAGALNCWRTDFSSTIAGPFNEMVTIRTGGNADDDLCATDGAEIRCWDAGGEENLPPEFSNLIVRDLGESSYVRGRSGDVLIWQNYTQGPGAPEVVFGGATGFRQVSASRRTGVCALHTDGYVRCGGWPITAIGVRWPAKHALGPGSYSLIVVPGIRSNDTSRRLVGMALTDEGRPRHFSDYDFSAHAPWRPW